MAITSSFANLATVTRASKKTDAGGWDGTSGGAVGTLSEYAANVAAIHATAGLRIDEASTNEIRNPRLEGGTDGALSGSGAFPTYFAEAGSAFTNAGAEVAFGTENGREYMDIIFDGDTPTGNMQLILEGTTQISAATGEDWTASCEFKLITGDFTNLDSFIFRLIERTSGNGLVNTNSGDDFASSIDSTQRRFSYSATLSGGGTVAAVDPRLVFGWTSGALTFTLRMYGPQVENKAYATSLILPTAASPAAASRAADDVSLAGTSWIGSDHTLYVEHVPTATGTGSFGTIFDLSDGTADNRIAVRHVSATELIAGLVQAGGSAVADPVSAGTVTAGTASKIALGVAEDDVALSVDGETQVTDSATGALFTPTELQLGAAFNASTLANGYIKDFRYWPRRLSNAELEALVGN